MPGIASTRTTPTATRPRRGVVAEAAVGRRVAAAAGAPGAMEAASRAVTGMGGPGPVPEGALAEEEEAVRTHPLLGTTPPEVRDLRSFH